MAITVGMFGVSVLSFILGLSFNDLKNTSKEEKLQMVATSVFVIAIMVIGGLLDA